MARIFLALFLSLAAGPALAQSCQEIRFAPGNSSGRVEGHTGNDGQCFTFATGAGQRAELVLYGPETMCVTLMGVGDCRESFVWTTRRQTYQVYVAQMFRNAPVAPFSLILSIH